jgi:hypothetical protein
LCLFVRENYSLAKKCVVEKRRVIGKARGGWRIRAGMLQSVPRLHCAGALGSQDPACFAQS